MAEKIFTQEEIKELRENRYVKRVSEKSVITYTDEFKEYFMGEYQKGATPTQILRSAGFDTKMLGEDRIKGIRKRYKKMAERPKGLCDTRKGSSGRQRTKDLTPEELIQRLRHKIKYLEQENAFLKKIESLEKREKQKQNQKTNSKSSRK